MGTYGKGAKNNVREQEKLNIRLSKSDGQLDQQKISGHYPHWVGVDVDI